MSETTVELESLEENSINLNHPIEEGVEIVQNLNEMPAEDDIKEVERLIREPYSYVRKKIRDQVVTYKWLMNLRRTYEFLALKKLSPDYGTSRCAICSLPEGTCRHTEAWLENNFPEFKFSDESIKTDIDKEIEDVLAVIKDSESTGPMLESKYVEDIDVYGMRWSKLEQRNSDKIESTSLCLSAPSPRGWQSAVNLADEFIVLFGGFSFRKIHSPQPLTMAPRPEDITCHHDTLIYDVGDLSWHISQSREFPQGRFGHASAAMSDRWKVIFGGRGHRGRMLNDTWIYDLSLDQWFNLQDLQSSLGKEVSEENKRSEDEALHRQAQKLNLNPSETRNLAERTMKNRPPPSHQEAFFNSYYRSPSPRVHAAMCAHGSDIYLFGGTDGIDNFGDMWVLTGGWGSVIDTKEENFKNTFDLRKLRWEQVLTVGEGPSARYGHSMVLLPFETPPPPSLAPGVLGLGLLGGPRFAILGGCDVSPQAESEAKGSGLNSEETKIISELCTDLQKCYVNEGLISELLAESLHLSTFHSQLERESHSPDESNFHSADLDPFDLASRTFDGSFATASQLRSPSSPSRISPSTLGREHDDSFFFDDETLFAHKNTISSAIYPSSFSSSLHPYRKPDSEMRSLLRRAAGITATIASVEKETKEAEQRLISTWNMIQGQRYLRKKRAIHSKKALDIVFFYIQDKIWKSSSFPPISGQIPCARMHFGCISTREHIVVIGGVHATSLTNKPVDEDHTNYSIITNSSSSSFSSSTSSSSTPLINRGESQVFVMDLQLMKWTQPSPQLCKEGLNNPIRAAEADIIRAKKRIEAEKNRGFSLGAPGGFTAELAQAEAVLEVCKWRKSLLEKEREALRPPPSARWGCSFLRLRQRCLLFCGWGSKQAIPPLGTDEEDGNMVLDMEGEMEKQRRLHDEFRRKVERESSADAIRDNLKELQSAFELRAMIRAERQNQAKERRRMAIEDICSAMPPLSKPSSPYFIKSNHHTIWVGWKRLMKNANNIPIDPNTVTYFLYAKTHYQHLLVGDRVLVQPPPGPNHLSRKSSRPSTSTHSVESDFNHIENDDQSVHSTSSISASSKQKFPENVLVKWNRTGSEFPGEITAASADGHFTIAFDDGAIEINVPRSRIQLAGQPHLTETGLQLKRENEFERDVLAMKNALTLSLPAKRRLARLKWKKERLKGKILKFNPKIIFYQIGVGLSKEKEKQWRNQISNLSNSLSSNLSSSSVATTFKEGKLRNVTFARNLKKEREKFLAQERKELEADREANLYLQENLDIWGDTSQSHLHPSQPTQQDEEGEEVDDNQSLSNKSIPVIHDQDPEVSSLSSSVEVEGFQTNPSTAPSTRTTSANHQFRLRTTTELTVTPSSEWKLVYSGNENEYACGGLVPQLAIEREPNQAVAVSFLLQSHGLEFPCFERSQLSEILTVPTRMLSSQELEGESHDDEFDEQRSSKLANRLKRQMFSTVVGENVVQIYRDREGCFSTGVSFHYL